MERKKNENDRRTFIDTIKRNKVHLFGVREGEAMEEEVESLSKE